MKKLITIFILCCAMISPILYAAYPNEFPIYLGELGFIKSDITQIQNGNLISNSLYDRLPGEYGIVAALVQNAPNYFFRDYYQYIESFKDLTAFVPVGKFSNPPVLQDLMALQLTGSELQELVSCQVGKCGMKLSSTEIGAIPRDVDLQTDEGRTIIANAYRKILLNRLLTYQKGGTAALPSYDDGPEPQNPMEILQQHIYKFPYLSGYFPLVEKVILEYPRYREKGMKEFFYWSKEKLGNKPVAGIHHVFIQSVGEDYVIVNKLVYSDHYFLSSIGILHLINYANKTIPRTLLVYDLRTLTDLAGDPGKALGRNILRANLEKAIATEFQAINKAVEQRYISPWYQNFPFGLLPRDQR